MVIPISLNFNTRRTDSNSDTDWNTKRLEVFIQLKSKARFPLPPPVLKFMETCFGKMVYNQVKNEGWWQWIDASPPYLMNWWNSLTPLINGSINTYTIVPTPSPTFNEILSVLCSFSNFSWNITKMKFELRSAFKFSIFGRSQTSLILFVNCSATSTMKSDPVVQFGQLGPL